MRRELAELATVAQEPKATIAIMRLPGPPGGPAEALSQVFNTTLPGGACLRRGSQGCGHCSVRAPWTSGCAIVQQQSCRAPGRAARGRGFRWIAGLRRRALAAWGHQLAAGIAVKA